MGEKKFVGLGCSALGWWLFVLRVEQGCAVLGCAVLGWAGMQEDLMDVGMVWRSDARCNGWKQESKRGRWEKAIDGE